MFFTRKNAVFMRLLAFRKRLFAIVAERRVAGVVVLLEYLLWMLAAIGITQGIKAILDLILDSKKQKQQNEEMTVWQGIVCLFISVILCLFLFQNGEVMGSSDLMLFAIVIVGCMLFYIWPSSDEEQGSGAEARRVIVAVGLTVIAVIAMIACHMIAMKMMHY